MDDLGKRQQQRYKAALQRCVDVAGEEYPHAQKALTQTETIIQGLRTKMEAVLAATNEQAGTAIEDAQERLAKLNRRLDLVVTEQLQATIASLAKKKNQLKKFTVTLFGRTMAGKSTIREALTHGDGDTIGKGAQRTTRDIREYEWDDLRIIDTPGIGAYKGDADSARAESVIDESDVLLFLVSSDSIQESSFRGMRAIRDQNKPIIFILNVKHDLTQPVYRRRFLKDAYSIMGKEAIRGHASRISMLSSDELGIRNPCIIPIHAQAAFLATRPEYASQKRALHRASGIDDLREELTDVVIRHGPVRRLQTLLDGTVVKLMDLEIQLQQEAKDLKREARYLKDKFTELNSRLDDYIGTVDKRIQSGTNQLLRPIRSSVSGFVDENIERDDVGTCWKHKVEEVEIGQWLENLQQQLLDEVRGHLEEFNREVATESKLRESITMEGPEQYDPRDVKRTLKRTSTVAGMVATVILTMAWNPVGWIAATVSVVSFVASWFFDDREQKLQRQKAKAAKQLREQLNQIERRIANKAKEWFYKNITVKLVRGIRQQTPQLYRGMFDLSRALGEAASECAEVQTDLNFQLLRRSGEFIGKKVAKGTISTIARDPGLGTKFIHTDDSIPPSFCREVGRLLGEQLDGVKREAYWRMIASALRPARIDPEKIEEINTGSHETIVRLPASQMGRAIGKHGSNVRLASRLMKTQIRLRKE